MRSPSHATAPVRARNTPTKRDVEADTPFVDVAVTSPGRHPTTKATARGSRSPKANRDSRASNSTWNMSFLNNDTGSTGSWAILASITMLHACIVVTTVLFAGDRTLGVADVLAVSVPFGVLAATKAFSKWLSQLGPMQTHMLSITVFSVLAASFLLQAMDSYRTYLRDRSYDFACFCVGVEFLWFTRRVQWAWYWAALHAMFTAGVVFGFAGGYDIFEGAPSGRSAIFTDTISVVFVCVLLYAVWESHQSSANRTLNEKGLPVTSSSTSTRNQSSVQPELHTPAPPRGGSPTALHTDLSLSSTHQVSPYWSPSGQSNSALHNNSNVTPNSATNYPVVLSVVPTAVATHFQTMPPHVHHNIVTGQSGVVSMRGLPTLLTQETPNIATPLVSPSPTNSTQLAPTPVPTLQFTHPVGSSPIPEGYQPTVQQAVTVTQSQQPSPQQQRSPQHQQQQQPTIVSPQREPVQTRTPRSKPTPQSDSRKRSPTSSVFMSPVSVVDSVPVTSTQSADDGAELSQQQQQEQQQAVDTMIGTIMTGEREVVSKPMVQSSMEDALTITIPPLAPVNTKDPSARQRKPIRLTNRRVGSELPPQPLSSTTTPNPAFFQEDARNVIVGCLSSHSTKSVPSSCGSSVCSDSEEAPLADAQVAALLARHNIRAAANTKKGKLLATLIDKGYPVELLPVNKTASSVVRVLHAFKGDVAARGLETARRSAWAAYGHRVGGGSDTESVGGNDAHATLGFFIHDVFTPSTDASQGSTGTPKPTTVTPTTGTQPQPRQVLSENQPTSSTDDSAKDASRSSFVNKSDSFDGSHPSSGSNLSLNTSDHDSCFGTPSFVTEESIVTVPSSAELAQTVDEVVFDFPTQTEVQQPVFTKPKPTMPPVPPEEEWGLMCLTENDFVPRRKSGRKQHSPQGQFGGHAKNTSTAKRPSTEFTGAAQNTWNRKSKDRRPAPNPSLQL